MDKKPLIVGNWKMELSNKAEQDLAKSIKTLLKGISIKSEVVVCPSFPTLQSIAEEFKSSSKVAVGAQNISTEEKGALTGQVSVSQIKPFVNWCIIGHSEVRAATGITDEGVMVQMELLQKNDIQPIICIGESAQERDAGNTVEKVTQQMSALLERVSRVSLTKLAIMYEPIWAISAQHTGKMPDPDEVTEITLLMRKLIANKFDKEAADRLRILYGGSVRPDNAAQYITTPVADGAIVGGASLRPHDFVEIVKEVEKSYQ